MISTAFLLVVLATAAPAPTEPVDAMLARVQALIARKDFAGAEALAQAAVQRFPRSRTARSTLAWAALWNADYATARRLFRELLATWRDDAAARLGLAQAEYWDGDLRAARRDFAEVLRLDPHNADARRSLTEIDAATRPGFVLDGDALSDDQPYRSTAVRATVYGFVDPVTKWVVTGSAASLKSEAAADFGAGVETTRQQVTVRGRARLFRFPDGERQLLPSAEVQRAFGSTTVALTADRHELLRAAPALASHPSATSVAVRWAREGEQHVQFAVHAERLRYFDGNAGAGADAYVLVPWHRFSAGASAAWRDTDQSRFNGAVYDPYYTPQDLREVRLIVAARWQMPHATLDLHLDGGAARDRLGAATRSFHPWRAALSAGVPLPGGLTLSLRGEHNVSVYYTANEFQTSVAGRF